MNKPTANDPERDRAPSRDGRSIRPRPLGADVAYTAEQIQVREGLEPVRRRPARPRRRGRARSVRLRSRPMPQ